MSGCRNEAGRLFQILGPAAEKLPISQSSVCSWHSEEVAVSRAKLATSGICNQLAVVNQVGWGLATQRFINERGQLVVDTLFHRQPVQATKNWRYTVSMKGSTSLPLADRCRMKKR